MDLIFTGLNFKIGTDGSNYAPPLYLWPKVTHMTGELLLLLLITFEYLCEKVRGFKICNKI